MLGSLICAAALVQVLSAQSCTSPLPMPSNAATDQDTSGLRPSRQPPIPVGGSLMYQCPRMTSIRGQSTFTVKCNDLQQYEFPPQLASWGECQCDGDLTTLCPGVIYSIKYVYQKTDKPSMTLTIPQPKGTTHWKVGLQMDRNVEELHVRTSDASMTLHQGGQGFDIVPLANNDFTASSANITMEYYFDNRAAIEANSNGEIPRWRFPCVAQVLTCEIANESSLDTIGLVIYIAIIGGVFIAIVCICGCCAYCIMKTSQRDLTRPNSVSSASSGDRYQPSHAKIG